MSEVRAELNNYRQSPRKVRVVADTVRGKSVEEAITLLSFVPKRAALPLEKLVRSAVANAKNLSIPTENLIVKEMRVDGGATLYRRQPRSRGMANPIRKRTSHVSIVLAEGKPKVKKVKKAKAKAEEKSE
jgi:large subunit ribosomal protein L22